MRNDRFVRATGVATMFGAVLWLVALFVEYGFGLEPPGEGALFTANQAMFFAAELSYLIAIAGLMRAGAVGGWFGRISLGLFFLGWTALASALGLSLVSDAPLADAVLPVGGIASTLGGLLAGIAVATGEIPRLGTLRAVGSGPVLRFRALPAAVRRAGADPTDGVAVDGDVVPDRAGALRELEQRKTSGAQ